MSLGNDTAKALEWHYSVPAKEDKNTFHAIVLSWLLITGVMVGVCLFVGIRIGTPEMWMLILKVFGILIGFMTVVLILSVWLGMVLVGFITKLLTGGHRTEDAENASESRDKTMRFDYRFRLDEEKLYSRPTVGMKGGRRIPYRRIRRLKRCTPEHRIEISGILLKAAIYAPDECFESVWEFLTAHCPAAEIVPENADG